MPSVISFDRIDRDRAEAIGGLLDRLTVPLSGEKLPLLWHVGYFLPRPAQASLGADGHPSEGLVKPPRPNMRRMFAGGRVIVTGTGLRVDDVAEARTAIVRSEVKPGRVAPLTFVTTRTEISVAGEATLIDERNLVFLPEAGSSNPSQGKPEGKTRATLPPGEATLSRSCRVDPTLLFRFSALTYNAHRIHYDRDWAMNVEGHAGLVVHGPLQALLMAELASEFAGEPILDFTYRLTAPLCENDGLTVAATEDSAPGRVHVWVVDDSGRITATATASTAAPQNIT